MSIELGARLDARRPVHVRHGALKQRDVQLSASGDECQSIAWRVEHPAQHRVKLVDGGRLLAREPDDRPGARPHELRELVLDLVKKLGTPTGRSVRGPRGGLVVWMWEGCRRRSHWQPLAGCCPLESRRVRAAWLL